MTVLRSADGGTRRRRFLAWLVIGTCVSALLPLTVARANVTLGRFTAEGKSDHVHLAWETGSEFNTAGYFVERSPSASEGFAKASDIIVATGGGPTGADYAWDDRRVERGTTYYYRLVEIESDQSLIRHPQIVCATPGGLPCRVGGSPPTATAQPGASTARPTTVTLPSPTAQGTAKVQPTAQPTAPPPNPTSAQAATRRSGGGASNSDRTNPTQAPSVSSPVAANPASRGYPPSTPAAGSRAGTGARPASTPPAAQVPGSSASTTATDSGDPSDAGAGTAAASSAQVGGSTDGGGTASEGGAADESSGTPAPQMAAMQPAAEITAVVGASQDPAVPAGADPEAGAAPAAPAYRWLWVGGLGLAFLFVARRVLRLTRQG